MSGATRDQEQPSQLHSASTQWPAILLRPHCGGNPHSKLMKVRTFGHRMMGTTPMVTSTEKRPSTMSSTAACADSHHHGSAHPQTVASSHFRMESSWAGLQLPGHKAR